MIVGSKRRVNHSMKYLFWYKNSLSSRETGHCPAESQDNNMRNMTPASELIKTKHQ